MSDSLKVVTGCNHLEFFLSKLEKCKELEEAAVELNMQILKIGRVYNKMGVQQFQHCQICAEEFSSVSTSLSIR